METAQQTPLLDDAQPVLTPLGKGLLPASSQPDVKRGRGRPRKLPARPLEGPEGVSHATSQVESAVDAAALEGEDAAKEERVVSGPVAPDGETGAKTGATGQDGHECVTGAMDALILRRRG